MKQMRAEKKSQRPNRWDPKKTMNLKQLKFSVGSSLWAAPFTLRSYQTHYSYESNDWGNFDKNINNYDWIMSIFHDRWGVYGSVID